MATWRGCSRTIGADSLYAGRGMARRLRCRPGETFPYTVAAIARQAGAKLLDGNVVETARVGEIERQRAGQPAVCH